MSTKVAIVTGSNKGIGLSIVRGLCKRFDGTVYLTARDTPRGEKAVAELEKEGLKPAFHQLDITDPTSVNAFRDFIKEKHGGIDVLVNNAAIAFKNKAPEPAWVQAEKTLAVNYFATLSLCNALFPLLRNGARVVNVSSSMGHLHKIPSPALRKMFLDDGLTVAALSELMQRYIVETKQGTQVLNWGNSSYGVSKVGLSALTRIQQRLLADRDIKVNSVHPGYVNTDMSSNQGKLTPDEGAKPPLFLAIDAPDSVKGQYVWMNCSIIDWNGELPE